LIAQEFEHPSLGELFASSQVSPAARFVTPSLHVGAVQSTSQLAVATPLASHASPLSTTPSPHRGALHDVRHALGVELLLAPALSL
jgi:hypothetical protein